MYLFFRIIIFNFVLVNSWICSRVYLYIHVIPLIQKNSITQQLSNHHLVSTELYQFLLGKCA